MAFLWVQWLTGLFISVPISYIGLAQSPEKSTSAPSGKWIALIQEEPLANELSGRAKFFSRSFHSTASEIAVFASVVVYSQDDFVPLSMEIWVDGKKVAESKIQSLRRYVNQEMHINGRMVKLSPQSHHTLDVKLGNHTFTDKNGTLSITLKE